MNLGGIMDAYPDGIMRTAALFLWTASAVFAQTAPEVTALTHVTVIDGTGAIPAPDTTVLIRAGRITAVYASASRPLPEDAKIEDLTGKWMIPGLIDAHVHITGGPFDLTRSGESLSRLLREGVTGLRDMAGDARILAFLARQSRLENAGWPDVYFTALMAGPSFFFEDPRVAGASRGFATGTAPWMRAVDKTTNIPIAMAEAKATGATALKLYANLPTALVKDLAAEAHRQGLPVWSHATIFPAKPSDAIAAGVDVISHTAYLAWEASAHVPSDYRSRAHADFAHIATDDPRIVAVIKQMKERGTILDATLRVFQQEGQRSPDAVAKGILPWIYAVTRAAHNLGVLVDAGTDSPGVTSDGPAVVDEMALLVAECGFTPLAAIQAATQVSAMAAGQGADRGTVAPGMAADLIVLNADPSVNVRNVRSIFAVMKDGRVYRPGK